MACRKRKAADDQPVSVFMSLVKRTSGKYILADLTPVSVHFSGACKEQQDILSAIRSIGATAITEIPDHSHNVCMVVSDHPSAVSAEKASIYSITTSRENQKEDCTIHSTATNINRRKDSRRGKKRGWTREIEWAYDNSIPVISAASFGQYVNEVRLGKRTSKQPVPILFAPHKEKKLPVLVTMTKLKEPFVKIADVDLCFCPVFKQAVRKPVLSLSQTPSRSIFHASDGRNRPYNREREMVPAEEKTEFCEICQVHSNWSQHVVSGQHQMNVSQPEFYAELDDEIERSGLSLEAFLNTPCSTDALLTSIAPEGVFSDEAHNTGTVSMSNTSVVSNSCYKVKLQEETPATDLSLQTESLDLKKLIMESEMKEQKCQIDLRQLIERLESRKRLLSASIIEYAYLKKGNSVLNLVAWLAENDQKTVLVESAKIVRGDLKQQRVKLRRNLAKRKRRALGKIRASCRRNIREFRFLQQGGNMVEFTAHSGLDKIAEAY